MNALELFCDTVLCCLKVFLAFESVIELMTSLDLTNKIKASWCAVGFLVSIFVSYVLCKVISNF